MELIKKICLNTNSINPIEIILDLMNNQEVNIHGPIHHILDGAAFITAMYNATHSFDLKHALDEMEERGKLMPGATCGKWGICGSCSSIGAALAIIHETGPLSNNEYYKHNMELVSQSLMNIASIGGPRCCKRNAYISLKSAIKYVKDIYGIELEDQDVKCAYSHKNMQCIKERCPFYD